MDRSKKVSQIITTFYILIEEGDKLFSLHNILPLSEIMVEELFEAKLNPFIRQVKSSILSLPYNDYTIVAIDSWLKKLNHKVIQNEAEPNEKEYAELLYLQQKYIPQLMKELNEIKLQILEKFFNANSGNTSPVIGKTFSNEQNNYLSVGSVAFLISQLYNFKTIHQDLDIKALAEIFGPALGCNPFELADNILFDKSTLRMGAVTKESDLTRLSKLLKSILARVESAQSNMD